jgi:hypothetical protein
MVTKVVGYTEKALKLFGKLRSREIRDLLNSVLRHLKSFRRNEFTQITKFGVTKKAFRSFVAKDGKGREEGRSWLGYWRAEEIVIYSAKVS